MPTYEYACKACGQHLEVVQSFNDGTLTECPACGGPLRKVFGNIGIAFKGSGFYKTDSRGDHKGAKAAEPKAGEAKSPVTSGSGTKSAGETGAAGGSTAKAETKAPSTKSPAVAAAS